MMDKPLLISTVSPSSPRFLFYQGPRNERVIDALRKLKGIQGLAFVEGMILVKRDAKATWRDLHPKIFRVLQRSASPRITVKPQSSAYRRCLRLIESEIRPVLTMNNGDIYLLGVLSGVVYLFLDLGDTFVPLKNSAVLRGILDRFLRIEGVKSVYIEDGTALGNRIGGSV